MTNNNIYDWCSVPYGVYWLYFSEVRLREDLAWISFRRWLALESRSRP